MLRKLAVCPYCPCRPIVCCVVKQRECEQGPTLKQSKRDERNAILIDKRVYGFQKHLCPCHDVLIGPTVLRSLTFGILLRALTLEQKQSCQFYLTLQAGGLHL